MKTREPPIYQYRDEERRHNEVVLRGEGVFAVVHQGVPIYLCWEKDTGNWRYPKTVFTHSAFAKRLATRLNKIFETTDFGVIELSNLP